MFEIITYLNAILSTPQKLVNIIFRHCTMQGCNVLEHFQRKVALNFIIYSTQLN